MRLLLALLALSACAGAAITSLEQLPNLILWLDASDPRIPLTANAEVCTWFDKSPLKLNASQPDSMSCPTVGDAAGKMKLLHFNGSQYLSLGQPAGLELVGGTDEFTVLVAYRVLPNGHGKLIAKADISSPGHLSQYMFVIEDDGTAMARIGHGGNQGGNVRDPGLHVLSWVVTTTTVTGYYDSAMLYAGTSIFNDVVPDDVLIGARRAMNNTGYDFALIGDLAEVAMVRGAVDSATLMSAVAGLQSKWSGFVVQPPAAPINFKGPGSYVAVAIGAAIVLLVLFVLTCLVVSKHVCASKTPEDVQHAKENAFFAARGSRPKELTEESAPAAPTSGKDKAGPAPKSATTAVLERSNNSAPSLSRSTSSGKVAPGSPSPAKLDGPSTSNPRV